MWIQYRILYWLLVKFVDVGSKPIFRNYCLKLTTVKNGICFLTELFLPVLMLNNVFSWCALMYLADSDLNTNMMLTWFNKLIVGFESWVLNIVKYARKWILKDIRFVIIVIKWISKLHGSLKYDFWKRHTLFVHTEFIQPTLSSCLFKRFSESKSKNYLFFIFPSFFFTLS